MMLLTVVIPSYNGADLLKQSLPLLFDSIRDAQIKEYEVIVVDSGVWPKTPGVTRSGSPGVSADKTINLLSKYPHIRYLSFPQPLGFAKATNIGIKKAQGENILLLNNDCLIAQNTIGKLLAFLKQNPDLSFTQPIIKESGKSVIGYRVDLRIAKAFPVLYDPLSKTNRSYDPLSETSFLPHRQAGDRISGHGSSNLGSGNSHLDKVVQLHNFVKQMNPFSSHDPLSETSFDSGSKIHNHNYIYGLSATCLLARKEAFHRIGLFDESFGSYLEDVDWCFRAVKQNVIFAPCLTTTVTHLHLQTSKHMGSYKAKHDFMNWIRIIQKHYPQSYIISNWLPLLHERMKNLSGIFKAWR